MPAGLRDSHGDGGLLCRHAEYGNYPGSLQRGLLEYRLDKPDFFLFESFSKSSLSVALLAAPREP